MLDFALIRFCFEFLLIRIRTGATQPLQKQNEKFADKFIF